MVRGEARYLLDRYWSVLRVLWMRCAIGQFYLYLISVATMHTADIQNSKDANSKCMPEQLYH